MSDKSRLLSQTLVESLAPYKKMILLADTVGSRATYTKMVTREKIIATLDSKAPNWVTVDDIEDVADFAMENMDRTANAILAALKTGDREDLTDLFNEALGGA